MYFQRQGFHTGIGALAPSNVIYVGSKNQKEARLTVQTLLRHQRLKGVKDRVNCLRCRQEGCVV